MTEMTGPVLAEESLDRFQPLGVFGQPVHKSHIQLQAALKRRLGDRYGNFFAAPRFDAQGNQVSWTSPVEGEVRRWSDLADTEQADRALDLQVMKSELEAYMAELRAFEGQGKDAKAATAFVAVLEQALKTPNDGYLYFVGDQPVSAFWGFREEEAAPFETLSAAPRARPVAAAARAAPGTRDEPRRWLPFPLWWLLVPLLLLLALLIWWFWPEDLPVVDEIKDPPAVEEPLAEDKLDAVPVEPDGIIIDRDATIVPGTIDDDGDAVVVPGTGEVLTPEPETAVESDVESVDETVDGTEATDGGLSDEPEAPEAPVEPELPAEPEAPGPEGEAPADEAPLPEDADAEEPQTEGDQSESPETAEPPEPEQPDQGEGQPEAPVADPGDPPAIPDDAVDGAAGFMRGQWQSESGLVDGQSKGRLSQEFEFDEDGKGESVVRKSDGVTCRAPADATVKDGNLHVEERSNLKCSDGTSFKRSRTVCIRGNDGKVRCRGVDADGKQFDVQLNKGSQP